MDPFLCLNILVKDEGITTFVTITYLFIDVEVDDNISGFFTKSEVDMAWFVINAITVVPTDGSGHSCGHTDWTYIESKICMKCDTNTSSDLREQDCVDANDNAYADHEQDDCQG